MRSVLARFWEKVQVSDGCWLWTASRFANGYGQFTLRKGEKRYAHRMAWELHYGEIPAGMMVCHRCDTRACVRVSHMFLGTSQDNTDDMVSKKRQQHGEGHALSKLTEVEVREIKTSLLPQKNLANRFGVSIATVSLIKSGKRWSYVNVD
jgi:hypothetical protein